MAEKKFWKSIGADGEKEIDFFRKIPVEGTRQLYSISAADKAKAVPFIMLNEISDANSRLYNSSFFTRNPTFGQPAVQFSERPIASIESLQVKSTMPKGWILFREITLNIVVHRPDVLNNFGKENSILTSILRPGADLRLAYGWTGGSNAIFCGSSNSDSNPTPNNNSNVEPKMTKGLINNIDEIRFTVTTFNFSIESDNQIKLVIHGKENGMMGVSEAHILDQEGLRGKISIEKMMEDVKSQGDTPPQISSYLDDALDFFNEQILSKSVERDVEYQDPNFPNDNTKKIKTKRFFISVENVFNILFAEPVTNALNRAGYSNVELYLGPFQDGLCHILPSYGGGDPAKLKDGSYSGLSVGDFELDSHEVWETLGQTLTVGKFVSVNGLMESFLDLIQRSSIWDLSRAPKDSSGTPDLQLMSFFRVGSKYARLQVVDRRRFINDVSAKYQSLNENKGSLKQFLKDAKIPTLIFFHQQSFFQDARFEATQDERMRSMFIADALVQTRFDVVQKGDPATQFNTGIMANLGLYKSAVQGTITMIGNFVFPYASYVYINFGLKTVNGLFYVLEKTDNISKDGFTSTYTFRAEGANPMGVSQKEGGSAQDILKERLAVAQGRAGFTPPPVKSTLDQLEEQARDTTAPTREMDAASDSAEFLDVISRKNTGEQGI